MNLKVKDFDEIERIILFIEQKTNSVFLRLKGLHGFRLTFQECFDYYASLKDSVDRDIAELKVVEAVWIDRLNKDVKETNVEVSVIEFKNKIMLGIKGEGVNETFCYSKELLSEIFKYSICVLEHEKEKENE